MIRQFIIPKGRTYTLEMPESFVRKKIELLAFVVEDSEHGISDDKTRKSVEYLFEKFEGLTFDSKSTYSFNRDEATDYE
ncbi:MAG: hypothetical protein ACOCXH_10470 [Cyclobacteriaceae bacterium]